MGLKKIFKKGKLVFSGIALGGALITPTHFSENQNNYSEFETEQIVGDDLYKVPKPKVYHCSAKKIDVFDPEKSRTLKAVFATPYRTLSFIYGIKEHGDYLFRPVFYRGKMLLVEMQPNVLEKKYRGKSAYLYTFNAHDFTDKTSWSGERISKKAVLPKMSEVIPDLEKELLVSISKDHFELLRFSDRNKYFNADELASAIYMKKLLSPNMSDFIKRMQLGWLSKLENREIYNQVTKNLQFLISKLNTVKGSSQTKNSETPEKQLVNVLDVAHNSGYEKAATLLEQSSPGDIDKMKGYLLKLQKLLPKTICKKSVCFKGSHNIG